MQARSPQSIVEESSCGDHTLRPLEILGRLELSVTLIVRYRLHAMGMAYPLLQLSLFRIRTFSAAVSGSFFTRLGIGLGFDPVQSGLLIMSQAVAALSTKFLTPPILDRIGFRGVLISNTVILGLLLMRFATIRFATPLWVIALQAFRYGAFASLQYTAMNTLVYADVTDDEASMRARLRARHSRCPSASVSPAAGLTTAFFISQ